jgi:hypothetical protein
VRGESDNTPESAVGGDPRVRAAVNLGWEMADLYVANRPGVTAQGPPEALPGLIELTPRQRVEVGVAKVRALVQQVLGEPLEVEDLAVALEGDAGSYRSAVYAAHLRLLKALEASDGAVAAAYDLGRSLADVTREPKDLSALIDRLEADRLLTIEGRLADLSSQLPIHSAAAVAATLDQWKVWSLQARARESMQDVRAALGRQRSLWRALLSGEKRARQMLDPDTVVAASVRHATRLGTLIRGLTGAFLPALAALVGSVVLLLWTIVDQSGIATVIAALGALTATMIGIRKSLALTAQATIEELRGELWSAELDAAVAQAILRLPLAPPPEPKQKLTLAKPALPAAPLTLREGITQRIERALHVTTSARKQGLRVSASGPAADAPAEAQTEASAPEKPSANGHQAP